MRVKSQSLRSRAVKLIDIHPGPVRPKLRLGNGKLLWIERFCAPTEVNEDLVVMIWRSLLGGYKEAQRPEDRSRPKDVCISVIEQDLLEGERRSLRIGDELANITFGYPERGIHVAVEREVRDVARLVEDLHCQTSRAVSEIDLFPIRGRLLSVDSQVVEVLTQTNDSDVGLSPLLGESSQAMKGS